MPRYYTYDLGRGNFCTTTDEATEQPTVWYGRWEITYEEFVFITNFSETPVEPEQGVEPPPEPPPPEEVPQDAPVEEP